MPSLLFGQFYSVRRGNFQAELEIQKRYKKAKVLTCKIYEGRGAENPTLLKIDKFDSEGRISNSIYLEQNDEIGGIDTTITLYKYDDKGRMSGYSIGSGAADELSAGFVYNDKDELTYQGVASAEAREFTFEYEKNLLMKEIGYGAIPLKGDGSPDWTVFETTTYIYNEQRQRVQVQFSFLGSISYTTRLEYDENQNLIHEKQWHGEEEGEPQKTITYSYNHNGLLIAIQDTEGMTNTYEYTYSDE